MKPSLCLNMIVRNEGARIERCLKSALPYVKAVYIMDTGSTDNTIELIHRVITDYSAKTGETVRVGVDTGEFKDFSQARNDAFRYAQVSNAGDCWCQFALLMDADMELVVADPKAFASLDANALSYDMMQKGGAVSYANRRVVNLNWGKAPYVGVTHEYIDVPAAGMITGAMFVDWADGSNRVDKFARDAELLEGALKTDPDNGRTLFYLGNTYRDWGMPNRAIAVYDKRITLGGWDEETHAAMMYRASCRRDLGDTAGFVAGMIEAYNFRPRRSEPLYDLARYYREKGDSASALLFATPGLDIERPNDLLFVNDFVYDHGLRYEFSVAGFYDEAKRSRAFAVTDDLALDPDCPAEFRNSARSNLFWYTEPLSRYCPSFSPTKIDFVAPDGYTAMNPSVEVDSGQITCNIRCVNYVMDEAGRYIIHGGGEVIDTRNFLVKLDQESFAPYLTAEVLWHRPPALWDMVTGLEDIRLWRYHGELHFSATVRERSAGGVCQIAVGTLSYDRADQRFVNVGPDWHIVSDEVNYEKNWMPVPSAGHMPRFMYRLNTVVELGTPNIVTKHETRLYVGDISGSSQLVEFNDGYLAVTHEASNDPRTGKRTYWHRLAWFDKECKLRRLSLPFVFFERQIEFCSGLALHPNGKLLLLSFGVRDAEAYVATVETGEVSALLWKFYES